MSAPHTDRAREAPVQASDRAAHALSWLAGRWPSATAPADALALEALAMVRMCQSIAGEAQDQGLLKQIAASVPAPRWTAANLSTSLLAASAVLALEGEIAQTAEAYIRAVMGLRGDDALQGPGAALIDAVLDAGEPAGKPDALQLAPEGFSGNRSVLSTALDDIECATRFGTRAIVADDCTALLLEGTAIAALRRHDLALGMRALRARCYLRADASLGLSTGLDFLGSLQREDGSFGDFDAAEHRLRGAGTPDPDLRLRLPATLHALWTMAEVEPGGFRLASRILPAAAISLVPGAANALR